jgi:predicted AAA+ superfamily ATPase
MQKLAAKTPVITVTGPRQSGKTTLCRHAFKGKPYANLEIPDIRQYAIDDPRGFLAQYPTGAVIDEIQRAPDLLSYIQGIVDEKNRPGMFVLTGSQQFEIMANISQSLAGRTSLSKLLPFSIEEMAGSYDVSSNNELLIKGFYPRIYDMGLDPEQALGDYVETYFERDLRQFGAIRDLALFRKFLRLCAGRVGQLLNLNSLANDAGISHTTARAWMSLLEASYIVYLLPPFHANIGKRLVKAPKLYFYDVGIASYLLGLRTAKHAERDPLRGSLFENLVMMEILKYFIHRGRKPNLFFYRDSNGVEVDIVIDTGAGLVPLEIKAGSSLTPDYFKSIGKFGALFKDKALKSGLVFGGAEYQRRTDIIVSRVQSISDLLGELLS